MRHSTTGTHTHTWSRPVYLVLQLGEVQTGPVEEVRGESHLVGHVVVSPLSHGRVLPLLEPLVLHHGQDGHAGLAWPGKHQS